MPGAQRLRTASREWRGQSPWQSRRRVAGSPAASWPRRAGLPRGRGKRRSGVRRDPRRTPAGSSGLQRASGPHPDPTPRAAVAPSCFHEDRPAGPAQCDTTKSTPRGAVPFPFGALKSRGSRPPGRPGTPGQQLLAACRATSPWEAGPAQPWPSLSHFVSVR